ncbi:inositol hexakisphosphate kinase 3 [Pelodytes ibericus]
MRTNSISLKQIKIPGCYWSEEGFNNSGIDNLFKIKDVTGKLGQRCHWFVDKYGSIKQFGAHIPETTCLGTKMGKIADCAPAGPKKVAELAMDSEVPIPLQPLNNQVGGHTSMLRYDNDTICKPLVSQEHKFYETLPTEMRTFTPQYKEDVAENTSGPGAFHNFIFDIVLWILANGNGIVFVTVRRDSRGHLSLIGSPRPNDLSPFDVMGETSMTMWHQVKKRMSHGAEQGIVNRKHCQIKTTATDRAESGYHSEVSCQIESPWLFPFEQMTYNPWGLHCHRQHLSRMSTEFHQTQLYRYLLLENVASKFSVPCILDLKMGTRQHGDDASEEKKARHIEKCALSTSGSLGVRICGMQVYQADTGHFLCKDKYYGRKLSTEGFRQALFQYLHNGYHLRTDLLDSIIFQLMSLKSVIQSQGSYRFYSSSLLIVYDGEKDTVRRGDNCIQKMGAMLNSQGSNHRKVDVRMIDFAHTTIRGSSNSRAVNEEPDLGYIFGIENLVKIFDEIRKAAWY